MTTWYRCPVPLFVLVVLVLVPFEIMLMPEGPATLAAPSEGWRVEGDAESAVSLGGLSQQQHFLRDSIRKHAEVRFWRTWTPSKGTQRLSVRSPAFPAPRLLAIPVTGTSSGTTGPNAVWIEHVATGQRKPVFIGSNHTSFNEVLVVVPPHWLGADIRLGLESDGRRNTGIGSPFAVSWLSYLKTTWAGRLPFLLSAMAVYSLFLFTGGVTATALRRRDLCVPLALMALGIVSMGVFSTSSMIQACGWHPIVGVRVANACAVLTAIGVLWSAGHVARQRAWLAMRPYALVWIFASLLVSSLCSAAVTGTGHWEPNYRFWPSTWSSDHELPWRFAEGILHGDRLETLFGGTWKPSDRPPLMAAAYLLIGDCVAGFQACNDGARLTGVLSNDASILLNALWIPVTLWLLREAIGGGLRMVALGVTFFAATVPYSFFSTTYGWPKAFGAAYALACFGLVIEQARRPAGGALRIPCVAGLAASSILAHTSGAFFLLPLGVMFAAGLKRSQWQAVLTGCAVAGVMLGSWEAWKRLVLPSADPVTKYALAGSFGFDRPEASLMKMVGDRYATMTLKEWLGLKQDMLIEGVVPMASRASVEVRTASADAPRLGVLRAWDFHVPTFGNAGSWIPILVATASACFLGRSRTRASKALEALALVSAGGIALYFLLCLSPVMLHHLAMASWFGLAIGGAGQVALRHPRVFWWLLTAQCFYGLVVWIIHPFLHATAIDVSAIGGCVIVSLTAIRWIDSGGNHDLGSALRFGSGRQAVLT